MKLGYMNVRPKGIVSDQTRCTGRAIFARDLGFSEFYGVTDRKNHDCPNALCNNPEQADILRVLSDLPMSPTPRIVYAGDQRRPLGPRLSPQPLTVPAHAAAQVKANAYQNHSSLSASWLTKEQLARHWAAHVTGSTHAGLRARPQDWRVARTIIICDDPARAEAAVKSGDSPCRDYYSKITKTDPNSAQVDRLIDACVLHGTLQSVLDELQEIVALSGPFGTLALVDHAWADEELAANSLASLASAVAPIFGRNRVAI